jgi:hypothetical protein
MEALRRPRLYSTREMMLGCVPMDYPWPEPQDDEDLWQLVRRRAAAYKRSIGQAPWRES